MTLDELKTELRRDWRNRLWEILLWPGERLAAWRIRRRIARMPRIQIWPLYDQPEHVIEGRASLRCWCEPELEECNGSILVTHRDRRRRLMDELPDPEEYPDGEYPISARQAFRLRMTLTDPTGFNMRWE